MPKTASNSPQLSEQECRKRLAAAYAVLLDLAARRRAEAQPTADRKPADANTDRRA